MADPGTGAFLPPERRDVGMVFQNYALWPQLTMARNVEFGLRLRRLPAEARRARVAEALAAMEIADLAGRYPNQLSGGQQPRVAIARTLAVEPQVLLLDEPLSNLDARLRLEMRAVLKRLHTRLGATIVLVTHDQWEAMTLASTIAVMRSGCIAGAAAPGVLVSWLPPDLADVIPAQFRDPLVPDDDAKVFAFNTEADQACPFANIWELTEPTMKGRLALQDPLNTPGIIDFFNRLELQADAEVAAAHEAHFSKPLGAGDGSATSAWVAALAANGPLLTESDQAVSDAVGAASQTEGLIGLVSTAKFRDNEGLGYRLGLCGSVEPVPGVAQPKLILVSPNTDSPNAARLYVHYAMTPEGLAPQTIDGKMPVNTAAELPADEPSGVGAIADDLLFFDAASTGADFDARQDWQDLWRVSYTR